MNIINCPDCRIKKENKKEHNVNCGINSGVTPRCHKNCFNLSPTLRASSSLSAMRHDETNGHDNTVCMMFELN